MPVTKFTNLDFDQIKTQIKEYLRANSNFTDFDFEGSNFSVLIDTLAYNTYISAFNSNLVVNESFLDSATLREMSYLWQEILVTYPVQKQQQGHQYLFHSLRILQVLQYPYNQA